MSTSYIIRESLQQYDTNKPIIKYLLRNTTLSISETVSDTARNVFIFKDKVTGEVILNTETEILGVYYDKHNVWCWGWNCVFLANGENYMSKKILMHAMSMDVSMAYIKSLLMTSRIVIHNIVQLDIYIALGANILKNPYIYPYVETVNGGNFIKFYILFNSDSIEKLKEQLRNGKIHIEKRDIHGK